MPLRGHNKGVPKSKFRKPGAYMEKKKFVRSHLGHLTAHLKVIKKNTSYTQKSGWEEKVKLWPGNIKIGISSSTKNKTKTQWKQFFEKNQ